VLTRLKEWRQKRAEKRAAEYAEQVAHMDRAELEQLRQQQSPIRSRGTSNIRRR